MPKRSQGFFEKTQRTSKKCRKNSSLPKPAQGKGFEQQNPEQRSEIVQSGGPSREEQHYSMVNDEFWFVLNTHYLKLCESDEGGLLYRGNAFKHALQTFGPISDRLPDLRNNEGAAKGKIFHDHVTHSTGITYILEWAIIDPQRRIMALVGFNKHENYRFKKKPLTEEECKKILEKEDNKKVIERLERSIQAVKTNVGYTERHSRHCAASGAGAG